MPRRQLTTFREIVPMPSRKLIVAGIIILAQIPISLTLACGGGAMAPTGTERLKPMMYGDYPKIPQLSELGRLLFNDPSLSASGRMSCASCHDPAHAYGSPNAMLTQPGGPNLDRLGFRNTPSLTYLHAPIPFTEHYMESQVTIGQDDEGPTGGRTWDGRVDSAAQQVAMPLTDPSEMANSSIREVGERVQKSAEAGLLRRIVSAPGKNVLDDAEQSGEWTLVAIATFLQSKNDFHPFTSKFDAWLAGDVVFSPEEERGFALFNNPQKGNCSTCHPDTQKTPLSRPPIFTDFGFVTLGVPRNRSLPANHDPQFHDLGLCGPQRTDLVEHDEYCGAFRTPSLRNVALRPAFFHNGAIHSLRDAVEFYVTRDINPEKWYPRNQAGAIQQFDDLPEKYWVNLERGNPFRPLHDGTPRLNAKEIDAIVSFLNTLTDGYVIPGREPPVAQSSK
jgi:cytochrome c peroxidase